VDDSQRSKCEEGRITRHMYGTQGHSGEEIRRREQERAAEQACADVMKRKVNARQREWNLKKEREHQQQQ